MKFTKILLTSFVLSVVLQACKEKTIDPQPQPQSGCATKSIVVTAMVTNSAKCANDGKLNASASGSSGFTFQLNTGAFQANPEFTNLTAGNYNVTAKDADGCTKTATFTIGESGTKGAAFSAVSSIVATKCQGSFCHSTGSGGAPVNILDTDCEIVEYGSIIKQKCVDGTMGALSTADKSKITAWLNAGGRYTD